MTRVLEYATPSRRRRRLLIAVSLASVAAIGWTCFSHGSSVARWIRDADDRRIVLRGAAATMPLDLGVGEAVTKAWGQPTRGIRTRLAALATPTQTANLLSGPTAFVGRLVARNGSEAVIVLDLNYGWTIDNGVVYFHLESYSAGSWYSPRLKSVVLTQARLESALSGLVFRDGDGLSFEVAEYRPFDRIVLGVPSVPQGDAATLRIPVKVRGMSDVICLTWEREDLPSIRLESGRGLPIRPPPVPTVQPTTRSAL